MKDQLNVESWTFNQLKTDCINMRGKGCSRGNFFFRSKDFFRKIDTKNTPTDAGASLSDVDVDDDLYTQMQHPRTLEYWKLYRERKLSLLESALVRG